MPVFQTLSDRYQKTRDFVLAAWDVSEPFCSGLYRAILRPLAKGGWVTLSYAARKAVPFTKGAALFLATRKDKGGKHHFSWKRSLVSLAAFGALSYNSTAIGRFAENTLVATYYKATETTYTNVYIPDAAVFTDQRESNGAQEKVYAVMGKVDHGPVKKDSKDHDVEDVFFYIRYNPYYFYREDAMRPELAASKLNCMSIYGVRAELRAVGFYNVLHGILPRSVMPLAARLCDVYPEIVKVVKVEELGGIPSFIKLVDTSGKVAAPEGLVPLKGSSAPSALPAGESSSPARPALPPASVQQSPLPQPVPAGGH